MNVALTGRPIIKHKAKNVCQCHWAMCNRFEAQGNWAQGSIAGQPWWNGRLLSAVKRATGARLRGNMQTVIATCAAGAKVGKIWTSCHQGGGKNNATIRHFEVARETRSRWWSSALWDRFGGRIFIVASNLSPTTVPQCTLTTVSTQSPTQPQSGE